MTCLSNGELCCFLLWVSCQHEAGTGGHLCPVWVSGLHEGIAVLLPSKIWKNVICTGNSLEILNWFQNSWTTTNLTFTLQILAHSKCLNTKDHRQEHIIGSQTWGPADVFMSTALRHTTQLYHLHFQYIYSCPNFQISHLAIQVKI